MMSRLRDRAPVCRLTETVRRYTLLRGEDRNCFFWGGGRKKVFREVYNFSTHCEKCSITVLTSLLLHSLLGSTLGGYIFRYPPRRYAFDAPIKMCLQQQQRRRSFQCRNAQYTPAVVELSCVGGVYTIRNQLATVSTSLNRFAESEVELRLVGAVNVSR